MTDYQPLQVSTPWKRALFFIGCGAVLLLGALGAAVLYLVKHAQSEAAVSAEKTNGPSR